MSSHMDKIKSELKGNGEVAVWINEDYDKLWEYYTADDEVEVTKAVPRPAPTFVITRGQQNELIRQLLTGPMGPAGVMGMMGRPGKDAE